MTTYIALLRGINVGGNKKVAMSKLKIAFEDMGYSDVSTYINTGNVFFSIKNIKQIGSIQTEIESGLKKAFGFDIKVILRTSEDFMKICQKIPANWKNDDEQKTDVMFLTEDFDRRETLDMIKTDPTIDDLKYISNGQTNKPSGAIVWNIKRVDQNKSGMKKFIGTLVYKNMTARNVNTVRKMAELVRPNKNAK